MEMTITDQMSNVITNLKEIPAMSTCGQPNMNSNPAPIKRTRKPRRSAKEIQAEYEEFKSLFEEKRSILEITHMLGLSKSQADSYLSKISWEENKRTLSYGVCQGHCIPESIRIILDAGSKDLFKFEPFEDEEGKAVVVKLLMSNK